MILSGATPAARLVGIAEVHTMESLAKVLKPTCAVTRSTSVVDEAENVTVDGSIGFRLIPPKHVKVSSSLSEDDAEKAWVAIVKVSPKLSDVLRREAVVFLTVMFVAPTVVHVHVTLVASATPQSPFDAVRVIA